MANLTATPPVACGREPGTYLKTGDEVKPRAEYAAPAEKKKRGCRLDRIEAVNSHHDMGKVQADHFVDGLLEGVVPNLPATVSSIVFIQKSLKIAQLPWSSTTRRWAAAIQSADTKSYRVKSTCPGLGTPTLTVSYPIAFLPYLDTPVVRANFFQNKVA
ncbi:hypothetical protein AXG93_1921s1030 [Marchantia polymorpha subsp. ruderalis]|uniref:Uncharacterized protein n=1 Tax=Marchantia polymorpha subsp. ruderalis TaxID=1480154 RepID=A0A176WL08_MARPO|nr:hypothetical protein AXG93_1921s1030 [Marchantia polymorpha subsp. ruderalis]